MIDRTFGSTYKYLLSFHWFVDRLLQSVYKIKSKSQKSSVQRRNTVTYKKSRKKITMNQFSTFEKNDVILGDGLKHIVREQMHFDFAIK